MTRPPANPARHDRLTLVLLVSTFVLMAATGWIVWRIIDGEPQDVLDNKVPQNVGNRLGGVSAVIPAATLGEQISVTGTKCNRSGEPVQVSGVIYWQTVTPPGTTIPAGGGQSTRQPGCDTRTYMNPMPDKVRERTEQIVADDGRKWVEWQIVGHENVVGDRAARSAIWWTQPFRLYVEAP